MTFHRFADLVISSDQPLPELPEAPATSAPDVVVTRTDQPVRGAIRWFQTWNTSGSGVRFGRAGDGYLVAFDDLAQVIVSPDADRVVIHADRAGSLFQMRYVLVHQMLPLVMSRRGRCVLHASAVSWRGRVVGFVGRTGSGKSTMAAACASLGAAVVTDDSLVLDFSSVTVLSSMGLGMLIDLRNRCNTMGMRPVIFGANGQLRDLLRMMKIDRMYSLMYGREDLYKAVA